MLKVSDLSFSYGHEPLYENVNFAIARGQKVGLVGPNGSGKSTLLKMLTGGEDGYSGKIIVDGSISLVPQEVKYDPTMESSATARDYIDPNNEHEDHEIQKLLSVLELDIELSINPQKFSGGQKTKLAIARALLVNPDILFLDNRLEDVHSSPLSLFQVTNYV